MRYAVFAALCAALCLLVTPVRADVIYGLVDGIVQYDDGLAGAGLAVTGMIGKNNYFFTTDDTGKFQGVCQVGQVVFQAKDAKTTVTVKEGEVTKVTVTIKRPGWVVNVSYPDGAPANLSWIVGAYKAPAKTTGQIQKRDNGIPLGKGRYWFPAVPANATAFAAIASLNEGRTNEYFRTRWSFDKPQSRRALAMQVQHGAEVKLLIVDKDGKPLPAASAGGTITVQMLRNSGNDLWSDTPFPRTTSQMSLADMETDGRGMLSLGRWPVQKYTVTLTVGDSAGEAMTFEVKDDQTVSPTTYTVKFGPRTVTQTVFTAAGKPVANTEVFASYAWQGMAYLLRQTSDAHGIVTWNQLPPTRVITWGEQIAAGVIPVNVSTVTAPLPAPQPQGRTNMRFRLTNLPPQERCRWALRSTSGVSSGGYDDEMMEDGGWENDGVDDSFMSQIVCGTRYTLQAVTSVSPPKTVILTDVYAPYSDTASEVECPLQLQEGAQVHVEFVTADGKPAIGVNRFALELVKPAEGIAWFGTPSLFASPDQEQYSDEYDGWTSLLARLTQPTEIDGGQFVVSVAAPGRYRVLIDLYDSTTSIPPTLYCDVKPGSNTVTVTLPEPLAIVPAGSSFYWLPKNAPARPQSLPAAAHAPAVPVYAPKDALLAYWYNPSADKLTIADSSGGAWRERTLSLRSTYLTVQSEERPHQSYLQTWPLLPGAMNSETNEYSDGYPMVWQNAGVSGIASQLKSITTLVPKEGQRIDLWTGAYICSIDEHLHRVIVPETGSAEIAVAFDPTAQVTNMNNGMYGLRLLLPTADYAALRKVGAQSGRVFYDVPMPQGYEGQLNSDGQESWVNVPQAARKLSIEWPGVGVIRDLPIMVGDENDEQQITLPAWSPGVAIAGTVLRTDGKPFANAQFTLWGSQNANAEAYYYGYKLKTDKNGKFSVKGLLPGPVSIWHEQTQAGWVLDIPEKGLSGVTLRLAAQPIRISAQNIYGLAAIWWLPDGGKPCMLPNRSGECAGHDLSSGSGWIWYIDHTGQGAYTRMTLLPGYNRVPVNHGGPSLGLYFPLDLQAGLPGAVTLIGQDDRAGINIAVSNMRWAPSAELNLVTGQIGPVPPGNYRLMVNTARGAVETTVTVTEQGAEVHMLYPPKIENEKENP